MPPSHPPPSRSPPRRAAGYGPVSGTSCGGAEAARLDARAEAEREGEAWHRADPGGALFHPIRGWSSWSKGWEMAGAPREVEPGPQPPFGPVGDFLVASEAGRPRVLLEDLVHRIRSEGLEGIAAAMLPGEADRLFREIAEEQAFEERMREERRRRDAEWSRGRDPWED